MGEKWYDTITQDIFVIFKTFSLSALVVYAVLVIAKTVYPNFPFDNISSGITAVIIGVFYVFFTKGDNLRRYERSAEKLKINYNLLFFFVLVLTIILILTYSLNLIISVFLNPQPEQLIVSDFETNTLEGWTILSGDVYLSDVRSYSGNYSLVLKDDGKGHRGTARMNYNLSTAGTNNNYSIMFYTPSALKSWGAFIILSGNDAVSGILWDRTALKVIFTGDSSKAIPFNYTLLTNVWYKFVINIDYKNNLSNCYLLNSDNNILASVLNTPMNSFGAVSHFLLEASEPYTETFWDNLVISLGK